ncbi:MAG: HAD family hydrolase [Acidimicrobiales bacterium]|nr:HAD family hydrolase [Acidimicrobiales bacterium]
MLFDLDDTLIDRSRAYRSWAEAFVDRHRADGHDESTVEWLIHIDEDGFRDREAWALRVKDRFRLDIPDEDVRAALHADYLEHYRIDGDTVAALHRLRKAGHRIGVVTNGPPTQLDKLRRNGLLEVIDGYVISDLVGHRKPARAIFEEAARACGGELAGGWMVGDSAPADMAGARAAGLTAVWLHRGRTWRKAAEQPDPWAVANDLPLSEPIPDGWEPDHLADSVPHAVEVILGA